MDASSVVFALISVKPYPLNQLVRKLPFARPTVYEAVRRLEQEGLVRRADGYVVPGEGYRVRALSGLYIQALTYGVDPGFLLRNSTLSVWVSIDDPVSFSDVTDATGLSLLTVKKAMGYLRAKGLVEYTRGKPVVAVRVRDHPLNVSLASHLDPAGGDGPALHFGAVPFRERLGTPEDIERALFEDIDKGIAVKGTGFVVKAGDDGGDITVLESVPEELTLEELFLKKLHTTEGAEDMCARMLAGGGMDYDRLLALSRERGLVNVVGCYLDILASVSDFVPAGVVKRFSELVRGRKRIFLKAEKEFGKSGWEKPYEARCNVDLYLDLGAIRHGVSSA